MTTMTKQKTEKKPYTFIDAPLNYLFSCRVRISEDQRQQFKDAYNAIRFCKQENTAPLSGSSVSSTTFTDKAQRLYQETGMSSVVIGDVIGSRESVSLPVILKLQRALGIEVVTKEVIDEAMLNYSQYVFFEMPL